MCPYILYKKTYFIVLIFSVAKFRKAYLLFSLPIKAFYYFYYTKLNLLKIEHKKGVIIFSKKNAFGLPRFIPLSKNIEHIL